MEMTIKESLENKIRQYAEAYYLGEQVASDQEFDSLCELLRQMDPENPLLKQVGFGIKIYGEKVVLPIEIKSSLPKIKRISEYTPETESILITPKIDGMSIIISIKNGVLVALTRGDGVYGVDITAKASKVKEIIEIRNHFDDDIIRGELYVKPSVFNAKYAGEYANPRNLVAGIINRKSFDGIEDVTFIPFDIVDDGKILVGRQAAGELYEAGIPTVFDYFAATTKSACTDEMLAKFYKDLKNEDLPLDGLVLDGIVAWKAENESVDGVVSHIDWQISPQGRLIPVAVLESPVTLYGTQVTRASAFNHAFVDLHSLGKGSLIKITKANEIIPYITEVVNKNTEYKVLVYCPKCSVKLSVDGVHLVCPSCYNPRKTAIKGFMESFMLPKGVQQAEKIIDTLLILKPNDLKQLWAADDNTKQFLVNTIGPSKTNLLLNHIDSLDQIDTKKFLSSLQLPGVGETASEEVSYHLVEYIHLGIDYLIQAGKVRVNAPARTSLIKHRDLIKSFYVEFINFMKAPKKATFSQKVCVTGKLTENRAQFGKKLEDAGIKLVESLDKDTILVTNDATSGSSKNKRANELGIEIISEEEARNRWIK